MADEERNIFISHIHEDDKGVQKLKDLLSDHGLSVKNYSVTSDKFNKARSEDYIKNGILKPLIKQCSVLVVYITPETHKSSYVNWEIDQAREQGKRIVGVWAYGEKGCELPAGLNNYAASIVGWDGSSIVDAITDTDVWEQPDGSLFENRNIARHNC